MPEALPVTWASRTARSLILGGSDNILSERFSSIGPWRTQPETCSNRTLPWSGALGLIWLAAQRHDSTAKSAAKECVLLSSGATGGAWFDRAQGERVRKEANVALPKVQTVRADGRAGASNQAADENLSTST